MSQAAADTMGGIGKIFGAIPKMLKGAFGPLFDIISSMSVFEPITALLTQITDIFGIAFIPIVQQIVQLITPFIPILVEVATALQPLFTLLFQLLTPFGLLANVILPLLAPILTAITEGLAFLNPYFKWLSDAISNLSLEGILKWITDIGGQILDGLVKGFWAVIDWFAKLPGVIWDAIVKGAGAVWDWITFWD